MKLCSKCQTEPRLENHPAYCQECRNEYSREWRKKNPGRRTPINREASRSWATARRKRNRDFVNEIKAKAPCADCGRTFHPAAMEFDHAGSEKEFCVGRAAGTTISLERLQAEIAKCEIVCSNCHAIRTWG